MFESEPVRLLPPELQWETVCPGKGESFRGFIAGPVSLHTCHYKNNASRPCRDIITKGKMLCYCAKGMDARRQIGYMPMLTRDNEKRVMLMCATTAKRAMLLSVGQPVEFWRPNKDKTPLNFKVLIEDEMGSAKTHNMARMKPHDIKQYLLRILWQDHELVAYFDKSFASSVQECAPPPAAAAPRPKLVRERKSEQNTAPVVSIVQGLSDTFKAG